MKSGKRADLILLEPDDLVLEDGSGSTEGHKDISRFGKAS
jgi:hypothetical protein